MKGETSCDRLFVDVLQSLEKNNEAGGTRLNETRRRTQMIFSEGDTELRLNKPRMTEMCERL